MGLGLVVLLIAVVGAIFALGDRYDLGPLAAGRLTTSLARRVSIGSLHVTPGRWLHVELRDFQLDNLPGGTQPVMMTVTTASAEIEAISLLHGPLRYASLQWTGCRSCWSTPRTTGRTGNSELPPRPRRRGRPIEADFQPCSTRRLRVTWCSGPQVADRLLHTWIGFNSIRRRQTNPCGSTGSGRTTASRSGSKPISPRSMRSATPQCRTLPGFPPPRAIPRCTSRAR